VSEDRPDLVQIVKLPEGWSLNRVCGPWTLHQWTLPDGDSTSRVWNHLINYIRLDVDPSYDGQPHRPSELGSANYVVLDPVGQLVRIARLASSSPGARLGVSFTRFYKKNQDVEVDQTEGITRAASLIAWLTLRALSPSQQSLARALIQVESLTAKADKSGLSVVNRDQYSHFLPLIPTALETFDLLDIPSPLCDPSIDQFLDWWRSSLLPSSP
jgi:hypothetical protein